MAGPAQRSLLWKLLGINLLVVGAAVSVAALAVARLADGIFAGLMREFHIEVEPVHRLFVSSLARSLVLTTLVAGGLGLLLSVVLFRRVVRPLRSMMAMAGRIAAGDYGVRAQATSADEVGSLADSLNRMAGSLATLERLRKDLVADVAHELRTPLANLRGYLEAMRDGVAPTSAEMIRLLHEEVMRIIRLVEALHELSLFDAHLPRVCPRDLEVEALVGGLVDLRRAEFAARGICLATGLEAGARARADPDLLAQAAHNLIDNALKYTPPGGKVTVDVRQIDGPVRVSVTNTGEGILPEDLPFIFERFYRGEKSRSRDLGGAGIGLSIVKEVAAIHGGQVGAESAGGRTTVWLILPASS